MSLLGPRSLWRGASKLSTSLPKCSISSYNKTPPAANKGHNSDSEQAHPIGAYYEAIIVNPQPTPDMKPEDPTASAPKATRSAAKKTAAAQDERHQSVVIAGKPALSPLAEPTTAHEKARIIFGTALAGPREREERLQAIKDKSAMIAGILVPPKPEEPDNCCMSGCVNCVWDRFRDEMEEWVSLSTQADRRLQAKRGQGPVGVLGSVGVVKSQEGLKGQPLITTKAGHQNEAVTMDDDGGGSDTNWPVDKPQIVKDLWDEDLYKGIPIGIREFMKTEKKLKQRHEKEGTVGG